MAEVRYGAAVLLVLVLVFTWVAWKGAHVDPDLFAANVGLLSPGAAPADRGPLPEDLCPAGWVEGPVSQYDTTNLYVKIDGREDYYRAFGFERLYFVSIAGEDDAAQVVDIELFDLGTAANALGAYAGERPPGVVPELSESGMAHTARNALFVTRGRYYVRAIGSDESPAVIDLLAHLRPRFENDIEGEPLPYGYALFAGALGIDPGDIDYMAENAFSFGFAHHVYAATLDDGNTRLFVTPAAGGNEAKELAGRFTDGFLSYGSEADRSDGMIWVRDRYISTLAAAAAVGPWVVGVRGATELEAARTEMDRLREAVAALPAATHEIAFAAKEEGNPSNETNEEASYGEDEDSYGEEESYAGEGEGGVSEY